MDERDQPAGTLWGADRLIRDAWAEYYAHAMEAIGIEAPRERLLEVGRVMSDWYTHPDRWGMFEDVPPVLEEAARRGLVQGVISDWGTDLVNILHGLELSPHMAFVVASATVGYAKPNPEIFQAALARAGVAPPEALYVGDTYVLDVLGARSAGMPAALIDRDGVSPPLDCPVLRRLDEIWGVIAEQAADGGAA
jgi:putative hydrolase of the HAD superfamily